MIKAENGLFVLHTKGTTYAFAVRESGQPEHLYYGARLEIGPGERMALSHSATNPIGCGCVYDKSWPNLCLEEYCLETSGVGKGDTRTPFMEVSFSDGSRTTDFIYESHQVHAGVVGPIGLPSAYDETGEAQTLQVTLKDRHAPLCLELFYTVFPACDCITRFARVVHLGREKGALPIRIDRLMSAQLDFETSGYRFVSFHGDWAHEMNKYDRPVLAGGVFCESRTGNSSNHANPFVMLASPGTTEECGECFASNLLYSGNHRESLEVDAHGKSRFLTGILPDGFSWTLEPGQAFDSPQAVLCYSSEGFRGISRCMHAFVREHIVRGEWKNKARPVLLNSWEAAYFKFDESKLMKLARAGKEAGVELFVMDDGWFGKRNSDTSSLGDWQVNTKKLPGGLAGLAEKIKSLGLMFGIWVEPEMVSEDSDLYRAHPDYAIEIPGRFHSEGRHQRLLDLSRAEVRAEVLRQMREVFSSADISYVKWDMNRNFSDAYSLALKPERQGEFLHRYILGLYEILDALTKEFPHILFEACASGGNRSDLGMLCYMPQVWASDNTDAMCRIAIQEGYSYGYPQSVLGCHVSDCPNHQTLRETSLETRFAVASIGVLGYECNLAEMPAVEREEVAKQIAIYKKWRDTLQFGQWYRLPAVNSRAKWLCVAPDQTRAFGVMVQGMVEPSGTYEVFRTCGLAEDKIYHFMNRTQKFDIRRFGGLVNMIAPIHIKKDSLIHRAAAHFVKMDSEVEDYKVSGACLNRAGIKLAQSFSGTGYEKNTRLFGDFDARVYYMEEMRE